MDKYELCYGVKGEVKKCLHLYKKHQFEFKIGLTDEEILVEITEMPKMTVLKSEFGIMMFGLRKWLSLNYLT